MGVRLVSNEEGGTPGSLCNRCVVMLWLHPSGCVPGRSLCKRCYSVSYEYDRK